MTGSDRFRQRVIASLVLLACAGIEPAPPAAAQAETSSAGRSVAISPGGVLPIRRPPRQVHFVPNTFRFWDNPRFATTRHPPKPAYADVVLEPANFVPCQGGPFALCYYSGPDTGSPDLSCTLTEDGRFANCECYEIPFGTYFVDINAILNYAVYLETVEVCGPHGRECAGAINAAPVCDYVNRNDLIPGADLISTFSFDCAPTDGLGQTSCSRSEPPYAGCMTAPCYRSGDDDGIVTCSCPTFDGPYQVGTAGASCDLGDDLVWSAAYAPHGVTYPTPAGCLPDLPGGFGCPLYEAGVTPLPPGTDCEAVCRAYACTAGATQPAFMCDATFCTSGCNDRDLVGDACGGLDECTGIDLLVAGRLEVEAGCSCCASQLCGCEPNAATNEAIFELNQAQRDRGLTPQCDVNGTLCGAP